MKNYEIQEIKKKDGLYLVGLVDGKIVVQNKILNTKEKAYHHEKIRLELIAHIVAKSKSTTTASKNLETAISQIGRYQNKDTIAKRIITNVPFNNTISYNPLLGTAPQGITDYYQQLMGNLGITEKKLQHDVYKYRDLLLQQRMSITFETHNAKGEVVTRTTVYGALPEHINDITSWWMYVSVTSGNKHGIINSFNEYIRKNNAKGQVTTQENQGTITNITNINITFG